jgi:hypothetical protein
MSRTSRFVSAIFALLISLALACNFTAPVEIDIPFVVTPTATPLTLPPAIVETDPPAGSQVGLQQGIAFFFNQPMNRASVEAALKMDKGEGIYTWIDDSTLTFTPLQPLPADSPVTFTLATGATAANGLVLLETWSAGFFTAPALAVTQTLPAADGEDIRTDSAIVVAFNQPVVPLGSDSASLPAGFSIEPAVGGRGEWLNTSTYIFHPDPGLDGGADYTVRVNPSLQSLAGLKLENTPAWAFRTSLPRVVEISPSDQLDLELEPAFNITFNQPMDQASVEADLRLEGPGGAVNGTFEWNENATQTVFKPAGRLVRAAAYSLRLSSASRSRGGLGLQADIQRNYTSVPNFAVAYTTPFDGGTKPYNERVEIFLTAPVGEYTADEIEQMVTVSPTASDVRIYIYEGALYIHGEFNPDTLYTASVSGDLADKWGMRLGQAYTFRFRSNPPEPGLSLAYLPVFFVRPEDPHVGMQITNLALLDVSTGQISLDEFFRLENAYQERENFVPSRPWTLALRPNAGSGTSVYSAPLTENDSLPPGLYFTRVDSSLLGNNFRPQPMTVLSSNINLTLKVAADSALAWAVDLRSGQPVASAPIALYDQEGVLHASGQTDASGLWQPRFDPRLDISENYYVVLGQPGDDLFGMAATHFDIGITPWEFGLPADFFHGAQDRVYLYTDRPVYRPGQQVSYRGIARQAFNGRYSDLQPESQWRVTLRDERGSEVSSAPITFSEFGAFSGQFTLPENASPSSWVIQVTGNKSRWGGDETFEIYFSVADYRKPEINLSVAMTPQQGLAGEPLTATVRADYFFGAPAADLPFTWKLYREPQYFSIPGFQSGEYVADWLGMWSGRYGIEVASGEGRTGTDGASSLVFDDLKINGTSSFTLEVTAIESGGFPLSARESAALHPASVYPGIRPAQWVGRAGTPLGFTLTVVGLDKTPQAGRTLQADFQKIAWKIRPGDEASPYPRYDKVVTPLEGRQVRTGADGLASVEFTPSEPGTYLLRAVVDGNASETLVWVGGRGQAVWPVMPFSQIHLTADQSAYQPGQMAGVFVPNPFDETVRALVTTERGAILSARILQIGPGGESVSIPLSDDNAPNTYVSVTLLGPDVQFRQGYASLEVDPGNFILNVDIRATPEKASPGESVQLDLRVTDSSGQPVRGEFSLAVVDLAALALADPNAPDIVPAFYDLQPLAVRTGLTSVVYAKRYFDPIGGMGGGGGGEGPAAIREDFPDTALWTTLVTNADGAAQITLTLPDNLTTWQVDARGLDRQTRVGGARLNLVTSKELLLRPIVPRYFVVGDRVRVSTYVNNTTASPLRAEVSLKASGVSLDDPRVASQQVDVPANGRALVSWWVTAGEALAADLVFSVKSGDLTDATRPNDGAIPILRYTAPQAFATAGVLPAAGMQTEIVSLPRSFIPLGGDLTLELAPSLGAYLLQAADSLPEPDAFSSNEAIASYLLANLAILPALREAGVPVADLAGRERAIQVWAGKLANIQNNDGGWNWYRRGMWGENISDPFLSAYAAYALARVAGPDPGNYDFSLSRARDYLASQMALDLDAPGVNLDEQAFLMLAYYGSPLGQPMGSLKTASQPQTPIDELYERRERLSPLGQAYLALAYLALDEREPARLLLANLAATANRSSTGAFWDSPSRDWRLPGTPLYTTAVIVHAMGQADPASPLLNDAVRYLAANRSATRDWGGAMQNAWVLSALSSALVGTGEFAANFPFSASLNGIEIASGQAASPQTLTMVTSTTPFGGLYLNDPNELKIRREGGNGKLYYRAILNVLRPAESAPALNKGIAVSREYFDCSLSPCQPIDAWQMQPETVGKITVRVSLSLPNDMYYLNVEDFAPAGAEIVNPTLKTSQQGEQPLEVEFFSPDDPYAGGWGWWYFDSPRIYSDHIQWTADYLPAGTYVLSYTLIPALPGEFRVLPARAWMTYFPEVQGASHGSVFEIRE